MVSFIGGMMLVGLATLVVRPQEIPKYSRIFGRFCGKSLKLLTEAKASVSKSKDTELLQMKKEFDFLMSEVATVRSEVKKGLNMRTITSGLNSENVNTENEGKDNVEPNQSPAEGLQETMNSNVQQVASPMRDTLSRSPQQTSQINTTLNQEKSMPFKQQSVSMDYIPQNPFSYIAKKQIRREPSFSLAFAELQELERQKIESDPDMRYPNIDPSRINSYDYDATPFKYTKTDLNLKDSPFSVIEFGHKPMNELYDDSSVGIRTEQMGGGADFVSINVLEGIVAEQRK